MTAHLVSRVAWRTMYLPDGFNFAGANQQTMASTSWVTAGWLWALAKRSPRELSISRSSVITTDIGAKASASSPSGPWMDLITAGRPEGREMISSPGLNTPPATRPAKPRKSWCASLLGRITVWTEKRGSTWFRSLPM